MADLDALLARGQQPARYLLDLGTTYSLSVFNFGLACCAVEFVSASMLDDHLRQLGAVESAEPADLALMVVSGTVTDKMAPSVLELYRRQPDPTYVMSFGSCANSGGPYWDSYCVTKGVDQILPVDVYVPGCPPRPEALLQGIRTLQQRVDAR